MNNNNETQDYRIGAPVQCLDGHFGRLARVVIDPTDNEVTDLVVEKRALKRQDRVIPLSAVADVSPEEINLALRRDQIDAYPRYSERDFLAAVGDWQHERYDSCYISSWRMPYGQSLYDGAIPMQVQRITEGIASTLDAIGRGTPVICSQGRLGTVNHILVNRETDAITHLIIRGTGLASEYHIMTVDQIAKVDDDGIHSTLTEETFKDLPKYNPHPKSHATA